MTGCLLLGQLAGGNTIISAWRQHLLEHIRKARMTCLLVCVAFNIMVEDESWRVCLHDIKVKCFGSGTSDKEVVDIFAKLYFDLLVQHDDMLNDPQTPVKIHRPGTPHGNPTAPNCPEGRSNARPDADRVSSVENPELTNEEWTTRIDAILRSTDPRELDYNTKRKVKGLERLKLVDRHIILFRVMHGNKIDTSSVSSNDITLASMHMSTNVCSIYNAFWRPEAVVQRGMPVKWLMEFPRLTIIHEVLHSRSSISARDQTLYRDQIPDGYQVPPDEDSQWRVVPDGRPIEILCRSWLMLLALAHQDGENHYLAISGNVQPPRRLALGNAYSLQAFAGLIEAFCAYPELDFLPDGVASQRTDVEGRPQLAHSCSAFDFLRDESAGRIMDRPGYKSCDDSWRNDHGEDRASAEKVLEVLGGRFESRYRQTRGV